jgi:hypothetical protein
MNPPRSDALAIFGASGDLAYKMIPRPPGDEPARPGCAQ